MTHIAPHIECARRDARAAKGKAVGVTPPQSVIRCRIWESCIPVITTNCLLVPPSLNPASEEAVHEVPSSPGHAHSRCVHLGSSEDDGYKTNNIREALIFFSCSISHSFC
ncbi:hypothetical protein CDAR_39811 [Caerostris darwini]|uniref:Uncharacterized protein n=1 Tax=Caerostris darwini TaxID=1538125 RepID=A0AAV4U6H1_9ARAC|nr:hypothetical protein CDAR_39811 [Caerostris darwini]